MARSTGPMLTAGAITWANAYLLADRPTPLFEGTVKVAVATGITAAVLSGIEHIAPDFAVALSWAAIVTVLFVRVPIKDPKNPGRSIPTPIERLGNILK